MSEQNLMEAYSQATTALRHLTPTDRLALVATLAGEIIAAAPDRNGRRQLLKLHDAVVSETVRQLLNGKGAN